MFAEYILIKSFIENFNNLEINSLTVSKILTMLNDLEKEYEIDLNKLLGSKIKFSQVLYEFINKTKDISFDELLYTLLKNHDNHIREEKVITSNLFRLRKYNYSLEELQRCFDEYILFESNGKLKAINKDTDEEITDMNLIKKISFSNLWYMAFLNVTKSEDNAFNKASTRIYNLIIDNLEYQLIETGNLNIKRLRDCNSNKLYQAIVDNLFYNDYRTKLSEAYFRSAVLKPKKGKILSDSEFVENTLSLILDRETMDIIGN